MCGRYSLSLSGPAQLSRFPIAEAAFVPGWNPADGPRPRQRLRLEPRYNICPGSEVLTVTVARDGSPRGQMLRWGLVPPWATDTDVGFKMMNARAETLRERPAYRFPFEQARCLIPADGFYEWQHDTRVKRPFHVTRSDGQPFAFAGLWSVWHRGEPDELRTCTIVTTAANARISSIHPRMPVMLGPAEERAWLDPASGGRVLDELLVGLPPELTAARAVGSAVNDARYDGPACLDDAPPELDPPQGLLFA